MRRSQAIINFLDFDREEPFYFILWAFPKGSAAHLWECFDIKLISLHAKYFDEGHCWAVVDDLFYIASELLVALLEMPPTERFDRTRRPHSATLEYGPAVEAATSTDIVYEHPHQ